MRHHFLWVLIVLAAVAGLSQPPLVMHRFEDYRVEQIFRGVPAAPKLSKDNLLFKTRIRAGSKASVEFAGHYTVPRFGCGTECSAFFIVDSVTGNVYDGFSVSDLPAAWLSLQSDHEPSRWEFHPNSRLFRVTGCINEKDCGYYDYLMVDGKGLTLAKKWLLPEKYQH